MNMSVNWILEMSMVIKNLSRQLIGVLTIISVVSACSTTPNNAPVVDRGVTSGGADMGKQSSIATPYNAKAGVEARARYVVKKGDTLFRIALDHGQSHSDIVMWNNLKNPNDIKMDQVLLVSPPEGNSTSTVQTASVNSGSGIEVRNLSSVNQASNKTSPQGDKRSYSEANLAELQKNEVTSLQTAAIGIKSGPDAVKLSEPTPRDPTMDQDLVGWIWPTEGKVVASFDDAKNRGLDISGKLGQDVIAAGAGKVMYEGSGIRGYGNLVIIRHTDKLLSAYAHNRVNLVKEGQAINKGQKIAEMGNSDSDAIKLHFEIRQQGKPVDPSKFLPGR
jgi:lipoprotein NlpD